MKKTIIPYIFISMIGYSNICFPQVISEEDEFNEEDIDLISEMSLSDLLNIKVTTASGVSESLKNAPAAMIVITAEDIEQRGYNSLDEIILDLPGFDSVVAGGPIRLITYQRGYRTPFTQRTLLMINGVVDNTL